MAFLKPVGLAGGDDGGGGGPFQIFFDIFKLFNDFVASEGGGFIIAQASGAEFNRKWEEFVAQSDELTQQTAQMLAETIGIGGTTEELRVNPDITNPTTIAWVQNRIDKGIEPGTSAEWLERFTETVSVPKPSEFPPAIDYAFEISREGRRLGKEFFDPKSAVERYQETFEPVVEGLEALPGQIRTDNERVQQLYANLGRTLQTGAADLTGGYEDILGTATGLVSGLGEAERQDINRRFTEEGTESQMALAARGLGGSTISSSIGSGIERERSTALLTLEEQIANQQLDVQETFGLAGLSARERLLGAGINLGGQRAGAMQFGNQLFASTAMGSLANRGNIAGGEFGAYDSAAMNRLNNLLAFGQFPGQVQLAGAGLGLDFYNAIPMFPQTPNTPPNIYSSFGG